MSFTRNSPEKMSFSPCVCVVWL
uniref:Uncharacterized protein n=1 Tax=Rhizophora mucronata TaxID=61149 RepID=A0A2P2PXP3_RHIMU